MFKRLSRKGKKDKGKKGEGGGDPSVAAVPYLEPDTGEAVSTAAPPPGPGPGHGKPSKLSPKKKIPIPAPAHKGPSDYGSQGYQIGDAAEKGDLERVKHVLTSGTADVNAADKYGMTALHRASTKGHSHVVRHLLLHGADIEAKNKNGDSCLYLSLDNGHIGTVGVLLDYMHSVDNRPREAFVLLRAYKKKENSYFIEQTKNAANIKAFQKRGCDTVQVLIAHGQKADDMAVFLYSTLDVPVGHAFFLNIGGSMNMKNFQRFESKSQSHSLTVLNTTVKKIEAVGYAQLRSMILVSCELTKLVLGGLTCLELLDVRYNKLDSLPSALVQCQTLKTLKCAHNHLRMLPTALGESPIRESLMAIDCSYNNIKRFDINIVNCHELRFLQCDHNGLVELPVDIGLLSNLEEFLVNNNKLSHLPLSVASLRNLKKLTFHTNPLQNIPVDFPERASEVRRYLMALQDDPVPNTMVKLVLVGQEGVGKTTLLKALKRTFWLIPRSPTTPKTDGIDVKDIQLDDLTLRCFDCGGDVDFNETHNFFITQGALYLACFNLSEYCLSTVERSSFLLGRLQLWLQYIFSKVPSAQVLIVGTHADHESLSKKVLEEVWEHLRQLMVRAREHHQKYFTKQERIKDCLLCQSDTKCFRRVSGVGNAGFVNLGFDDATSIDSETSAADGPTSEMSFPHIVGYYEISSVKTMGNDKFFQLNVNQSMEHLKDAIKEVSKRLISRNPEIPRRWASVQESLQNYLSNNPESSVTTIDEVARIAKVQRVADRSELVNMLQFFKAQGHVLYFPQLDNLENTVVLDPEWLAKIFATVVSFRDTGISTEGFIDRDQLKQTWIHMDDMMKDRILTLLRHFGLCLPVRETNMELFPSKLPLGEPDEISWPVSPQRGERQVSYSVTFPTIIPPPFFSNLMVTVFRYRVAMDDLPLTPRYFSNQILDWLKLERAGCQTCGQSQAGPQMSAQYLIHRVLFQMIPHKRTVQFTVRGATPCCMVKIVGRILNKVMRHFEGLGAIELDTIVCPGCVMQRHSSPHKFSANYLLNEHKPKEKVFCSNDHVVSSSKSLLCGIINESCMPSATIRPKSSRDRYDYSGCPKLFMLLPVNKDGLSFDRDLQLYVNSLLCDGYAAHLLCEFPDGYHLLKAPGFRVKMPKEFMQTYGDHVLAVLRLLGHVAESSVSSHCAKQNKAVARMVPDIVHDIRAKFPFVKDTSASHNAEQLNKMVNDRAKKLKREDIRNHFHIMDRPDTFGSLRRLVYGEQTLWLCDEHFRQLRMLKVGAGSEQAGVESLA